MGGCDYKTRFGEGSAWKCLLAINSKSIKVEGPKDTDEDDSHKPTSACTAIDLEANQSIIPFSNINEKDMSGQGVPNCAQLLTAVSAHSGPCLSALLSFKKCPGSRTSAGCSHMVWQPSQVL